MSFIRFIEAIIERNTQLGFVVGRDMARLYLTEVYLELLAPSKPAALSVIAKNFRFLVITKLKGWQKAMTMMQAARKNPMFSGSSHWRARVEANLGFLHMLKKQHAEARACLMCARPIAERLNSTALLAKVDAALARLPKPSAEHAS